VKHSSTPQAAKAIGVRASALARAVWDGRVNPPQKSPAGNYLWTAHDIEHASWVLCHRSAGLEDGPQHISEILPDVLDNIAERSDPDPHDRKAE
jgi:hypothetical protein